MIALILPIWFAFWAVLAYFLRFDYVTNISFIVLLIFLSFPSAMVLGVYAGRNRFSGAVLCGGGVSLNRSDVYFVKTVGFLGVTISLINIILMFETASLLEAGLSMTEVRSIYFGLDGERGGWFYNRYVEYGYNTLYAVVSSLVMCFVVIRRSLTERIWYFFLILALVLVLTSSFVKGGRGELFGLIVAVTLSVLDGKKFKKELIYLFAPLILIVGVMTYLRGDSVFNFVIKYHTLGFHLFSIEVDKLMLDGRGYTNFFGLLSGLDGFINIVLRFFIDSGYYSALEIVRQSQSDFITLVNGLSGNDSYASGEIYRLAGYNSFYTAISSLYRAGGLPMILIFGYLFGFAIYRLSIEKRIYYRVLFFYLFYFGVFFVFSSPLEIPSFFFGIMCLNLTYIVIKFISRKSRSYSN